MELERSKRRIAALVAMFETPEVRARLKAAHAAQLDLTGGTLDGYDMAGITAILDTCWARVASS